MVRFQLEKMYTNPDYDRCMSSYLADNCKIVSRAFYDFINNADAKFDGSGNVISIQEWINEPIFCLNEKLKQLCLSSQKFFVLFFMVVTFVFAVLFIFEYGGIINFTGICLPI